jgi:hypothetical protein
VRPRTAAREPADGGAPGPLDITVPASIILPTMSMTVGMAGFVFTCSNGAGRDGV